MLEDKCYALDVFIECIFVVPGCIQDLYNLWHVYVKHVEIHLLLNDILVV